MTIPTCTQLPSPPTVKQIQFPGGASLEQILAAGSEIPDSLDVATTLLSQANAALAPLVPLFDILDTVLVIVECVKAIPDALGPPPDPSGVAACLPVLSEKVAKLLALVPQLSLPALIVDVLDCVIGFLEGVRASISALIGKQAQIVIAQTRATELGDANLEDIVACAEANLALQIDAINESLTPVTRLLSIISGFLELLGLPTVPDLATALDPSDLDGALAVLTLVINTVRTVRDQVPIP